MVAGWHGAAAPEAFVELTALESAERLAETHISTIVAIGDRVYKRKKPAAFGFVDQRSLEARRLLCEQEVALNKRFAPDVYLGTEPVVDATGSVCDHAVVMRRMPRERCLATMLDAGGDGYECVRRVARLVAEFHLRARRSDVITAAGTRDAVHGLWRASLDDLASFPVDVVDHDRLTRIGRRVDRYLLGRGPLFYERCRQGMIVDGHGDLLCADVYCLDDGPRVLDCLEFDERFRFGDVLLDVAFLAMDLRRRGRADLAELFVRTYGELSGEHHPASLLAHFVAYRALVRAKVALYRVRAGDTAAAAEATALLDLVEQQLAASAIRLVLVGGLPGTGKTAVAEALAARTDWVTVNTDAVRRELLGGPAPARWGEGAYSRESTEHTYQQVLTRAATALSLGESVVVDASFHEPARRAAARSLAEAAHADVIELRCTAPRELASARLRSRDRAHPSDATPSIAAAMARAFAPWPEAIELDTSEALTATVARACALVDEPLGVADGS